jgi:hypothetical protein
MRDLDWDEVFARWDSFIEEGMRPRPEYWSGKSINDVGSALVNLRISQLDMNLYDEFGDLTGVPMKASDVADIKREMMALESADTWKQQRDFVCRVPLCDIVGMGIPVSMFIEAWDVTNA